MSAIDGVLEDISSKGRHKGYPYPRRHEHPWTLFDSGNVPLHYGDCIGSCFLLVYKMTKGFYRQCVFLR